jgi:hypothetical protein
MISGEEKSAHDRRRSSLYIELSALQYFTDRYNPRKNNDLYRNIQYTPFEATPPTGDSSVKKGAKIWILSTLTFASLACTIDGAIALISNSQAQLPRIIPFLCGFLTRIPTDLYLYVSVAITAAAWALTCVVAFNNPSEIYLNRKLADIVALRGTPRQVAEEQDGFGLPPQREQTESCQHWYGYLSQRQNEEPIPQECVECREAVECMLNQALAALVETRESPQLDDAWGVDGSEETNGTRCFYPKF